MSVGLGPMKNNKLPIVRKNSDAVTTSLKARNMQYDKGSHFEEDFSTLVSARSTSLDKSAALDRNHSFESLYS